MSRLLQTLAFAVALVALVALAPPKLASAREGGPERVANAVPDVARPLPLTAVRLTGGPLKRAQELDAKYLMELEPDRMPAERCNRTASRVSKCDSSKSR